MSLARFLPSGQFFSILLALLVSGGVVYAAQYVTTHAPAPTASLASSAPTLDTNWEATLSDSSARNAALPEPPSQEIVQGLLEAARSNNVTDTVGKSLLINLTTAAAQGLGSDIPTQNQLIAQAQNQIPAPASNLKLYTAKDLTIVPDTQGSRHTYGNDTIRIIASHQTASEVQTLLLIGKATDTGDITALEGLAPIGKDYAAVALELSTMPVPQTFAPFHLLLINDLLKISATYPEMSALATDPLRGITGLNNYEKLISEAGRVLTNIAQQITKDGILFTKDEPGNTWAGFLPAS